MSDSSDPSDPDPPDNDISLTRDLADGIQETIIYAPEMTPSGTAARLAVALGKADLAFLESPQAPDEIGRLGPYRVLQLLGVGGMGVVFRAEDTALKRVVALKVVRPEIMADPQARLRFMREAQAAAALRHDHIVVIYQVGEHPPLAHNHSEPKQSEPNHSEHSGHEPNAREQRGVLYLTMEFLAGETLADRLKRLGPLPLHEVLQFGAEIADGLAAAHRAGLVHRDIKPGNLWVEERPGRPARIKILDFGLARSVEADGSLTQTGVVMGTLHYMSPEQAGGEPVDQRADLFSLGSVLYCMTTAKRPFAGENYQSALRAVLLDNPPPPTTLRPDLPAALSDLILRLLSKEPQRRPQSADDVYQALNAIRRSAPGAVDGSLPAAAQLQHANSSARAGLSAAGPPGRVWRLRTAFAIVAVAAVLGIAAWHHFNSRPRLKSGEQVAGDLVSGDSVSGDSKSTTAAASPPERVDELIVADDVAVHDAIEPATAVPLADAREPFVLERDGEPPTAFLTLAAAVEAAKSGDSIEIQGHGPFFCETIRVTASELTIRAGAGYRPRLVYGRREAPADGDFLAGAVRLVLEGLELVQFSIPETASSAIISNWGNLRAANCRFVLHGPGQAIHAGDPDLVLKSCEFLMSGESWGAIQWYPGAGASDSRIRVEGCLFYSPDIPAAKGAAGVTVFSARELQPFSIEITGSTFATKAALCPRFLNADEDQTRRAGKFCQMRLSDNVFATQMCVLEYQSNPKGNSLPADRAAAISPEICNWIETGNVYTNNSPMVSVSIAGVAVPSRPEHHNLAAWRQWIGSPDTTSQQHAVQFRGAPRSEQNLEGIRPEQFQLATGQLATGQLSTAAAAGRASGDTRDPGVDVRLVGPGSAYDAWRQTPEYQDWRKAAGR